MTLPIQYPDSSQIRHGENTVASALADLGAGIALNNIAALRASTTLTGVATVLGNITKGDGGGNYFYWDATSTEADNGVSVIQPNSLPATGRWKRQLGDLPNINIIANARMRKTRLLTYTAPANGSELLDNWTYSISGGTPAVNTVTQSSDTPAVQVSPYSMRLTVTTPDVTATGSELIAVQQSIQGQFIAPLVANTFTLSFWVRSPKAGVHCLSFANGATDRSYVAEYTITQANVWERKDITVEGGLSTDGTWNYGLGKGLQVRFALLAGAALATTPNAWRTGNYYATAAQVNTQDVIGSVFGITGVQLCRSPVANNLALSSPAVEETIPPISTGARQTVKTGQVTTYGTVAPNMLQPGVGLAINLSAADTPLVVSFAAGMRDYLATLNKDVTNLLQLYTANISYVYCDYVTPEEVVWGKTLAKPQYSSDYDNTKQALLHFDEVLDVTHDDFGGSWSIVNGAKAQTTWSKFGGSALGGSGANNALNGTNEYLAGNGYSGLGSDGWSLRAWVRLTALPAASGVATVVEFTNGAFFGALLGVHNAAGVIRFAYSLSSNGTANNVASLVRGTTNVLVNTDYFVELTYDATAGVYRLYVNGNQEASTTSSLKVCATALATLAARTNVTSFLAGYIDEFEFLPYCDHPLGNSYELPSSASSISTEGYAADWFSIPEMVMYRPSAPAKLFRDLPIFTPITRVYVGQVYASAGSLAAVVNYAFNGEYRGEFNAQLPGAAVRASRSHTLGLVPEVYEYEFKCVTEDAGYAVGDIIKNTGTGTTATAIVPLSLVATDLSISFTVGIQAGASHLTVNKATGAGVVLTNNAWVYRFLATRGW